MISGRNPKHPEAEEAAGQVGAGLRFCQSPVRLPRFSSDRFQAFLRVSNVCFALLLWTQVVAGDQVDNLRNKHSGTDGQGGPAEGGSGRGHEQGGALQGNPRQRSAVTVQRYHHATEENVISELL